MTRAQKITLAAYGVAAGAFLAWLVVVPAVKGLLIDEEETFSMTVTDLTTSVEEDLEIIVALREFFENNNVGIGHDGATAWAVDD